VEVVSTVENPALAIVGAVAAAVVVDVAVVAAAVVAAAVAAGSCCCCQQVSVSVESQRRAVVAPL